MGTTDAKEQMEPQASQARVWWVAGRNSTELAVKRALDIGLATLALIVLSPILAVVAVLVKVTSPGPVIYRWRVLGKDGRPFVGYKFRSMVVDADARKPELLRFNEMTGPVFKMARDPRVTPVGRVIRKFSLDEMPQLWNVIKGDMSLVGPRPVFPHEWEQFEPWHRRKLSVQPGMICLWHVRGKPREFDEWVKLDLEYIDRWSLWLDIKILMQGLAYIVLGKSC